jgi:uncharacterized protein
MSRVLVVTGGPGPDHAHDFTDPVTGTGPALVRLFAADGHDVDMTVDPETAFRALGDAADGAAQYDAVVVNALRWRMDDDRYARWRDEWALSLSDTARDGLVSFVHGGGGLVGSHTASICFDDWPGWGVVLGGSWVWGESSHPPVGPVRVHVDGAHPVTVGVPASFEVVDEVYGDMFVEPFIDVLATARRTPDDDDQPIAWALGSGGGRVVYCGLGHDVASIEHPAHAQLLRNAVRWVAHQNDEATS